MTNDGILTGVEDLIFNECVKICNTSNLGVKGEKEALKEVGLFIKRSVGKKDYSSLNILVQLATHFRNPQNLKFSRTVLQLTSEVKDNIECWKDVNEMVNYSETSSVKLDTMVIGNLKDEIRGYRRDLEEAKSDLEKAKSEILELRSKQKSSKIENAKEILDDVEKWGNHNVHVTYDVLDFVMQLLCKAVEEAQNSDVHPCLDELKTQLQESRQQGGKDMTIWRHCLLLRFELGLYSIEEIYESNTKNATT